MSVTILQGSALDVLKTLPSESAQACITSPPYFGLRSYGTSPQVWGGDPEHSPHEWGDERIRQKGGQVVHGTVLNGRDLSGWQGGNTVNEGAFCPCGAWRGELGGEPTPALFIEHLLTIFDEVGRVLRRDGTCWVNLGDSYSGSGKGGPAHDGLSIASGLHSHGMPATKVNGIPAKNLLLIPERFAIGMQERGWTVRSRIAWCKTSVMPESVRDRPTSAWEHIWMFSKQARYFYDADAVRQPHAPATADRRWVNGKGGGVSSDLSPLERGLSGSWGAADKPRIVDPRGANLRNFWLLGPEPSSLEHYAGFPTELPKRCILAGSHPGDTVLDPFLGSGTTALVADRLGRDAIGIELNPTYADMARRRIEGDEMLFSEPVRVETPVQAGLFEGVEG